MLGRAFEAARLMRVPAVLPAEEPAATASSAAAPAMQEVCKAIGRVAPQDVNVLILGESGTGKELVARALYQHSRRADRPFLAINCAAIPETLLESELFGHEKGAFTGADRRRIGKFEQCDGGTLFLDEIGDMRPPLQAKMLRVLQEQRFERLGGNETVQTHVRVLAATNHDLEKLVAEGRFREDLYYRLKGVTIRVPPLRERPEDVPELAHYFLFRFNRELGRDFRAFAPEALELLQSYPWPGNVRELQGVDPAGDAARLGARPPARVPAGRVAPPAEAAARPAPHSCRSAWTPWSSRSCRAARGTSSPGRSEALERVLLERVLRQTQGHQTQASELLGISRNTCGRRCGPWVSPSTRSSPRTSEDGDGGAPEESARTQHRTAHPRQAADAVTAAAGGSQREFGRLVHARSQLNSCNLTPSYRRTSSGRQHILCSPRSRSLQPTC